MSIYKAVLSHLFSTFVAGMNQNADALDSHLSDGVHQKVSVTSTDDATSSIDAPLKTAGGLAVAKTLWMGNGFQHDNKTAFFKFNNYHGVWEYPINQRFDAGKKIRIRYTLQDSTGEYVQSVHVVFSGSQASGGSSFDVFSDKKFVFHAYNNVIQNIISDERLVHGFGATDIDIIAVGSGNQVDLIIKNPLQTYLNRWFLSVEWFSMPYLPIPSDYIYESI